MNINVIINQENETPIYKQIVEQITENIHNGTLKEGDKLPPERELAQFVSIARGTITKAYQELARRKIIEVVRGSGCFVLNTKQAINEKRKKHATSQVVQLLANLEELNFSYSEIKKIINSIIEEREKNTNNILIAIVDCNPEAFSIFKRQLSHIPNLKITNFLITEIYNYANPEIILNNFDLVLTTSSHYGDLLEYIPGLKNKIIQAVVSQTHQTLMEIAMLPKNSVIGIVCKSEKFLNIIKKILMSFRDDLSAVAHIFEHDHMNLESFIEDKSVIIIPPNSALENKILHLNGYKQFKNRTGKILIFEYQFERGSIIHIEEQISKLLNTK